jgi:hypothetical protein
MCVRNGVIYRIDCSKMDPIWNRSDKRRYVVLNALVQSQNILKSKTKPEPTPEPELQSVLYSSIWKRKWSGTRYGSDLEEKIQNLNVEKSGTS